MLYTSVQRGDGFGAVFQNNIYDILYAYDKGHTYVFTPQKSFEHNYNNDPNFANRLCEFTNMNKLFPNMDNTAEIKEYDFFYTTRQYVDANINRLYNTEVMQNIKQTFFLDKKNPYNINTYNVAVHVRRSNPHDTRIEGTDTPNSYYIKIMNHIRNNYTGLKELKFHIYSQGKIELFKDFEVFSPILHIDTPIEDTFLGLVFSDTLIQSKSSLSYTAALLTYNEVYYQYFWCPPLSHWKIIEDIFTSENNIKQKLIKICKENNIPFNNDKIIIPDNIKHIKIDIGLSYSAPQSQNWLKNENNLIIFGFEPNPESVNAIKSLNNQRRHSSHGDILEHKYIDKNFFLIPIALSDTSNDNIPFYITSGDVGCSSILKPNLTKLPDYIGLDKVISISLFKLSDFFKIFPFDKHSIIEYIKVDAQGSDLKIIKGGGSYIQNHVVYITLEAEASQYENSEDNSENNILEYMNSIGFERVNHPNTNDPTFVNNKFKDIAHTIYINQN